MLRPKLNRLWASTNPILRRDPGDAKYIQGWVSEIPTYQVLNYLQYKIDTTLLALAERGIFEWGDDVQYQMGSAAWDSGTIYISTVGNPSKLASPKNNPSEWSPSSIQIPKASFDDICATINAHIADLSNPHKVSAGAIGAYTKGEIDQIVSQYNALVKAHVDDRNNPHGTTAADIGAVPVSGGTYTGPVTFSGNYTYFDIANKCFIWSDGKATRLVSSGVGMLGINSAGIPVGGDRTTESPLVTDSTFPANKQLNEPKYAVESPAFHLPLIKNICPIIGNGVVVTSQNWTPVFSDYGPLEFQITGESRIIETTNKVPSGLEKTYCIDVYLPADTRDLMPETAFILGSRERGFADAYLFMRVNGEFGGEVAIDGNWYTCRGKTKLVPGWSRIAVVLGFNYIKVYFNGKLDGQEVWPSIPQPGGRPSPYFEVFPQTNPASHIHIAVRNLRVWTSILTDEQISTL